MKFSNVRALMKHYNSRFHANEERPCIFSGCKTILRRGWSTSAMNHFRLKHKNTGNLSLKPDFLIIQAVSEMVADISPESSSNDRNMNMTISLTEKMVKALKMILTLGTLMTISSVMTTMTQLMRIRKITIFNIIQTSWINWRISTLYLTQLYKRSWRRTLHVPKNLLKDMN